MKGVYPNEIMMLARVASGGAILYAAIAIMRGIRSRARSKSGDPEALNELWRRFERGEISWDEYEASSRDLEGRTGASPK